jgi:hypothetical protein
MCTVTIVPRVDGFRVACNRDERDSRPPALGPGRYRVECRTGVFPTDPQSGGTWIGANDAGLVLALLNRTETPVAVPTVEQHSRDSRGLVIPSLLGLGTLRAALRSVQTINPVLFEPFRLVMVQGREVGDATSDGRHISIDCSTLTTPLLFTSSSLGDAVVERPRRRLFNLMIRGGESTWLRAQRAFHRHRWRRCPELSVHMQRKDARTVSRSLIDVRASTIDFRYEPLERAAELVGPC